MDRIVLHCDLNNFFASVECVRHPEYREMPLAVCGSEAQRHGICLAKNYAAKKFGIATGDTVMTVRRKCPDAVIVEPHYDEYEKYSRLMQQIYAQYTDQIEPFGCDESWLDVSGSTLLFGSGADIAERIRREVKQETALTVSIGVSYNKIFAKLGSDMKKPDAVTAIPRSSFREIIWDLPASAMLGVGPATFRTLERHCVHTIGQLAAIPVQYLQSWLGKSGSVLWRYANGLDDAAVVPVSLAPPLQSISRGMTPLRDIQSAEECAAFLREMAQDVGRRLRKNRMQALGVRVSLRDTELFTQEFQQMLPAPSAHTDVIADAAVSLMLRRYRFARPLRSATLSVFRLIPEDTPAQLELLYDLAAEEKKCRLEDTIDSLRAQYGAHSVHSASYLTLTQSQLLPQERAWNPAFSLGEGARDGCGAVSG